MASYSIKTKRDGDDPRGKARVYFTCHEADFARSFERICNDIFQTHHCAIYYTADMTEEMGEEEMTLELGQMNLFVIPVSARLLSEPNRAMRVDFAFAKEKCIPVLPLLLEEGLDKLYALPKNFGDLQYLAPYRKDKTAIPYEEKLKKYLDEVLFDDGTAKRVRSAFDAYVFLSYRKKDRRYAMELMKRIHRSPECWNLAIWYDEFLIPGENFQESIAKSLKNSRMVALLVTPHLLEEGNYVMRVEYPAAKQTGVDILPVEMVKTDRKALKEQYENFPDCVEIKNQKALKNRLLEMLKTVAVSSEGNTPEHDYLMGLAYLDGIDVEVDGKRGVALVTAAAKQNMSEGMEKLFALYYYGKGVRRNYRKALVWAEKRIEYHKKASGEKHPDTQKAIDQAISAFYGIYYKKYHRSFAWNREKRLITFEEKLMEFKSRHLGEDHPDVVRALIELSGRWMMQGNRKKSIRWKEPLYDVRCRSMGEDHPDTLCTLKELAFSYFCDDRYQKSVEAYEKLYAGSCRVFGEDHPETDWAAVGLADAYRMVRNDPKALVWMEKKYAIWCKMDGEGDPRTLEIKKEIEEIRKGIRRNRLFAKALAVLGIKR
jgi:hypothetical protein